MTLDTTTYARTTDYDRFKDLPGNRTVNPKHVAALAKAVEEDAAMLRYNPIIVNEKWEVIDGQHRVAAAKLKNQPVYYINEDGLKLKEVISLNSGRKSWTPVDYAESWVKRGVKVYETYLNFRDTHIYYDRSGGRDKTVRINHDILIRYLALDEPMTTPMFKDGKLVVPDEEKSARLCEALLSLAHLYPRWNNRNFALAFMKLWMHPEYSHQRMVDKLTKYPDKMEDKGTIPAYFDVLRDIYNFNRKDGKLAYFA